ncbi:hypothetical protein B0H10DRAFT_1966875 [Mycena sp. CBHHK59/15]|nr:hypothetical protein B0H10DRAFT_1966875 [Mycena sp. CBHHK59/15]
MAPLTHLQQIGPCSTLVVSHPIVELDFPGLLERFHITHHFLGLDSCVVASTQYTMQDGLMFSILFPMLRTLIETHAPISVRLEGNEATSDVYLVQLPSIDLSHVVDFSGKHNLWEALESQLVWNFETQTDLPLWRIEVLARNIVIFAVHHVIGNGMSCMVFHLNLFQALQEGHHENSPPSVQVPTTTILLPPIECPTNRAIHPPGPSSMDESPLCMVWLPHPNDPQPLNTCLLTGILCARHCGILHRGLHTQHNTHIDHLCAHDNPVRYKWLAMLVAISLRSVAGVGDEVICNYQSVHLISSALNTDFSWKAAACIARELQVQKRKSREGLGTLQFLLGQYGEKHKSGLTLSNLGRIRAHMVEGRWTIGGTVFTQCNIIIGSAFSINITGDPTGALNFSFCWGETNLDSAFIEMFISLFWEAFRSMVT